MITDVPGLRVGHWTDPAARTGCTVVLFPEGTVASGEVRGGAPATRETTLLEPTRTVARLDALVLRAGLARTTAQARQMVVHRHILVDGKLVDRPSFRLKEGQMIHVKPKSEKMEIFQVSAAGGHVDLLPKVPAYLEVEIDKLQARLVRRPKRAEVPVTCEVQLVVEYYAR